MHNLTAAMTLALLTTEGGAGAAEIKALISTAVAEAMAELVPQFERASGHTLRITYVRIPDHRDREFRTNVTDDSV